MNTLQRLDKWHKTVKGHLTYAAVELIAGFIVISGAIDTGRLLLWTAGIVLLVGGLQNLVQAVLKKTV